MPPRAHSGLLGFWDLLALFVPPPALPRDLSVWRAVVALERGAAAAASIALFLYAEELFAKDRWKKRSVYPTSCVYSDTTYSVVRATYEEEGSDASQRE